MPSKLKVVVVEDHAGVGKTIERILRVGGLAPVVFDSAEAALEANAAASADCLVLDIHLPGMSGPELYRRLTHSGKEMPASFITACDEPAFRDEAEKLAGPGRYLLKPFIGDELLDAVTRALGRH